MLRKQSQRELRKAGDGDTFIMLPPTSIYAVTYPHSAGTVGGSRVQKDGVSPRYEMI